ncbi:hypothetical protein NOK12_16940 [Nocardioides sp. OK12]|uniref:hypothetical protein n=1 Tax=Nocardioides sp. OK12 TaxID=2758661 RepID=UPI0021C42DD8|nr:hypothetical protein [Nocardioides sp. OK12]GHJ59176.1 hypothetical protein NOK12_16940 [Nocardioides sp. OK12]
MSKVRWKRGDYARRGEQVGRVIDVHPGTSSAPLDPPNLSVLLPGADRLVLWWGSDVSPAAPSKEVA